eukprot:5327136-Heterocapsa_arctica.AAC.1
MFAKSEARTYPNTLDCPDFFAFVLRPRVIGSAAAVPASVTGGPGTYSRFGISVLVMKSRLSHVVRSTKDWGAQCCL